MNDFLKKRSVQFGFALVLVAAFAVGYRLIKFSAGRTPPPNVIAEIDGRPITSLQYKTAMRQRIVRIMARTGVVRGADRHDARVSVFKALMNDRILEAAAENEHVKVKVTSAEAMERVGQLKDRFYKTAGRENPGQFNLFMQNLGFNSEVELAEYVKYEIYELKIAEKLYPDELIAKEVTEEDIVDAIPFLKMKQIFFSVNTEAGDRDVDVNAARSQIREKAQKVYRELLAGRDFGGLARQYSSEVYSEVGGDIGWVSKSAVVPKFWKVASSLRPGEISAPFETEYGIHILMLEQRLTPNDELYRKQRDFVAAYVIIKKRQAKFASWFYKFRLGLEEHKKIKIYDPYLLGVRHELLGEFEKALEQYRLASKKEPNDPYIIISIGGALARKAKYTEALKEFQRAIEVSPLDPSLYYRLGEIYMSLGEHQKALLEFSKASDMSKLDGEMHMRLESLYMQLGLLRDADRERQRYLMAQELRRGKGFTIETPSEVPSAKPNAVRTNDFPEMDRLLNEQAPMPGAGAAPGR